MFHLSFTRINSIYVTWFSSPPTELFISQHNPMAAYTAMFEISEGPYSGLTGAEVSASQFAHQYPGFVQKFQEPFSTNLGIGMPMGSSITSSTSNQFGQGPFSYDRFDQREFYNGEFINALVPRII